MDPVWISVAFVFGFAMRQVGLPPLVGFLIAGFVLNAMGAQGGLALEVIAELGVTLLLFSIGLKLRVQSLLRPEVWAGASLHMLVTVLVFGAGIYGLSAAGVSMFAGLDAGPSLLIAFALSFSSTVFAVKVLEERGEMASLHGRVSIGILIMQDVIAVVFLALSSGKAPSPWAFALLGLLVLRPLFMALLDRSGHGELLVLCGLFLALVVGAAGFDLVGMKADLGALCLGMLVAEHPKAAELAKSLLSFKDLLLVGFFLNIGLTGGVSLGALGIATLLALVAALKVVLFFVLLTRFKLRARTSLLAALSLANYSEFGLIVAASAVAGGWIGSEWLVVIAIALSMTFVLAAPLNSAAHSLYARFHGRLEPFEAPTRHPDDQPIDAAEAEIVIFGMGRVGTGAYEFMRQRYGDIVAGLDSDPDKVAWHREAGRNVILGDAADADFWHRLRPSDKVQLVMLAMSNHVENMFVAARLADSEYAGLVAATARFSDEIAELEQAGVHAAFNLFAEAGTGFAEHACEALERSSTGRSGVA